MNYDWNNLDTERKYDIQDSEKGDATHYGTALHRTMMAKTMIAMMTTMMITTMITMMMTMMITTRIAMSSYSNRS